MPGAIPGAVPGAMQMQMPYYAQYPQGMQGFPAYDQAQAQAQAQAQVQAPVAVEEKPDPERAKNVLPIYGSSTTFNINTLLFNNIMESDYFKALYQLKTYHEIVDEIYPSVSHVGPWQTGTTRIPSTAFCLLLKFFLMRLTIKQMKGLLHTDDCPFVRAIGFLYLRYSCPPSELWGWFEPFLEDEEEFTPSPDASIVMTMGQYLRQLLTDMKYFGTTLPRIPVLYERKFQVMLLLLDERVRRRKSNMHDFEKGRYSKGTKVMAIYQDEDNEPAWYEGVIEGRDTDESVLVSQVKFWVNFTEYGNTESVDLGDMKLLGGEGESQSRRDGKERRKDSRDRGSDRESRDRNEGEQEDKDFLAKVLQKQRDSSVAVGKNYASRPVSYKSSLSLKMTTYTVRKKSPTRTYSASSRSRRSRSRSRDRSRDRRSRERHRDRHRSRSRERDGDRNSDRSRHESSKPAMSREQQDRMKKLRETYGDASSK